MLAVPIAASPLTIKPAGKIRSRLSARANHDEAIMPPTKPSPTETMSAPHAPWPAASLPLTSRRAKIGPSREHEGQRIDEECEIDGVLGQDAEGVDLAEIRGRDRQQPDQRAAEREGRVGRNQRELVRGHQLVALDQVGDRGVLRRRPELTEDL